MMRHQYFYSCRFLLLLSALLLAALVQGISPIRSTGGVLLKTTHKKQQTNNVQPPPALIALALASLSSNSVSWGASSALSVRGGSEEEEQDDDEQDEDDEEEDGLALADQIIDISKRGMVLAGKVALETYKALQRAIQAGFQGDDDDEKVDGDDEEPHTVVTKVLNTLKRMIKAALARPQEESEDEAAAVKSAIKVAKKLEKKTTTVKEQSQDEEKEESASRSSSPAAPTDFGTYLSKAYGVPDERDENGPAILGGTLSDALKVARSQARLLVVLLPSGKPKKVKGGSDKEAIASVLSLKVAQAANKRARKNGEESGSFLFWGAKAGSSEATAAIKRLKTKATSSKGEKRPVLSVVYPAQTIGANGVPKITATVLAQHHCSPPPASSLMAQWLNALRKRHAKQYNSMQSEMKEIQYFKEREEGYRDSVDNDIQRKEKEAKEEAERLAKEKAEIERMATIQKRRADLKSALPPEDKSGKAKTVALRFADGKSGQRKFAPNTPLSTVFDWVDAMFEIERETLVLTTLNGKQAFSWDSEDVKTKTLEKAGLGRMTGLRVTEKKPEASEEKKEESTGEDSQ